MIKNTDTLLKVSDQATRERRKIILDIIEHVLAACSPHALLASHIKKLNVSQYKKIAVIAIGKAARTMGKASVSLLGRTPDFELYADSGHPLPTPKGIANTNRIMKAAQSLGEKDLAIVLVSGGGSAMFVAPATGITLADKIETTRVLLMCGATINEINCVRKHLSQVKGGRLARLLCPATVKAFVISDVVGNDLSTIASGPLCADTSTFQDAIKIISKYKAPVPNTVRNYLENNAGQKVNESVKKNDPCLKNVTVKIIADHYTALNAAITQAQKIARKTKHSVVMHKTMLTGEARDVAKKFIKKIAPNTITVASGETTVTCCKDPGHGGRNQEFVVSALEILKDTQTIASFGTDGIDGMCPTKVAGALGDTAIKSRAHDEKLTCETVIKKSDSFTYFRRAGGHIITGPTGNNLGDVVIAVS